MRFIARNVKRTVKVLLAIAGTLTVSIFATLAYMRAKFERLKAAGVPEGPQEGSAPAGERTMDEVMERLIEVPFEPPRPMSLGLAKAALCNSFLLFQNTKRATAGRMYPYPGEFEETTIESFDGTPLTVAVGVHRDGRRRPGLVLSHGFMGSKNDHYIVESALTAYAGWGFNVLGIDLRNFGRSQCLSHAPTTAGWKEGEDLLAAAKFLGEKPEVTTVGITGFSMGAGSTMRAAYMARDYPYLTGGAIAWNGYSSAGRMVHYISEMPSPADPFFPVYLGFRMMHRLRREDMKDYINDPEIMPYLDSRFEDADFVAYTEKIAAPHYGVTVEEFYRNASSMEWLADVEAPLLIVHAADDPICPPSEMDPLIEIAEENPNVEVWMLPAGNHCMFMYMDRFWYDAVMRGFFSYWAEWE